MEPGGKSGSLDRFNSLDMDILWEFSLISLPLDVETEPSGECIISIVKMEKQSSKGQTR